MFPNFTFLCRYSTPNFEKRFEICCIVSIYLVYYCKIPAFSDAWCISYCINHRVVPTYLYDGLVYGVSNGFTFQLLP